MNGNESVYDGGLGKGFSMKRKGQRMTPKAFSEMPKYAQIFRY